MKAAALAIILLAGGCAASPGPAPASAPADPVAVFVGAVEWSLPGNPHAAPFRENAVVTATAREIVWQPLLEPEKPLQRLRYADIDSIAFHVEQELPSRPEAIFIYLKSGGWFADPAFVLRRRPPGTYRALEAALAALSGR